jgi:hypothetical protein
MSPKESMLQFLSFPGRHVRSVKLKSCNCVCLICFYCICICTTYRAGHVRVISDVILYATKNTNDADHLIPFIM